MTQKTSFFDKNKLMSDYEGTTVAETNKKAMEYGVQSETNMDD